MSSDYWYRQSSHAGFNLVPIGLKGFSIFALNLISFALPIFNIAAQLAYEGHPKSSANLGLSIIIFLASILLFIYSLKYKSDYTPHDKNKN